MNHQATIDALQDKYDDLHQEIVALWSLCHQGEITQGYASEHTDRLQHAKDRVRTAIEEVSRLGC